jgi:hypothetical protein
MARATLSALLTNLSGRYGGGVFRNWKGLTVLGVLPESVRNPGTAKQTAAREVLAYLSKCWSGLDITGRGQWEAVGAYLTSQWENFSNEVGTGSVIKVPRGPFGGLTALSSCHALLASIGDWDSGDALISAPVGVTAPSQPTALNVTGDTNGMIITATVPASWGDNGTAGKVRAWFMSEDGTFFAQLAGTLTAGTLTVTHARSSGGGIAVPLTPGWYFVQVDAVNAEGLRSAPSNVFKIDLAAHTP